LPSGLGKVLVSMSRHCLELSPKSMGCFRGPRATGPSQTPGKPALKAKRREQGLSALAVYRCVGLFRGQNFSSPNKTRTSEIHNMKVGNLASPRNRLHHPGHRKVTNGNQTRWLTPAGLCISTRKFGAFASCQTSLVAKPRDTLDTHRHPKRFKLESKAQNHGTTPKHVPCSETLQKRHFRVFVPPRGFGEKR
jgi:hypothetical protein